ncbi:MAG: phosphate propanoyltransferase [Solobacterium sp.]|nr:phosphate propanoyltransferase [Solobacterium sp.]MBR2669255.1 phosphate propanoyltransferase [Solobacterium sp.]
MEKFLVEVSARHIHLCREDMDILFGKGSELHPIKDLSQPGQYASEEKLTMKGPKGQLTARILGPLRKETQIEVSLTEARQLGVKAQIRESGDLDGTSGDLTLVGPCGEIVLERGVIAAKRHVHMTPADAENYGVVNGQIVAVKIETNGRSVIFGDTVVRVSNSYALAMHIDTDEANAAAIGGSAQGEIVEF